MSTKTLRKRIALVAVSALGAGLMSIVAIPAANAADAAGSAVSATAAASGVNTSGICAVNAPTTSTTPTVISVGGTQEFAVSSGDTIATISGNAVWAGTTSASTTFDATKTVATVTGGTAGHELYLSAQSAGSFTVTFTGKTTTTTTLKTFYLTAVTSCVAGVSAANSFVQVTDAVDNVETAAAWLTRQTALNNTAAANGTAATLDTSNDVHNVFANDAVAYIAVRARDNYKGNISGSTNLMQITCDNSAKVNSTAFNYYAISTFGYSTGTANIPVRQAKSNVPMKTTCTVSVNGVTLATKTITFQGTVAKLEIAASRNGDAETPSSGRIKYTSYDSAGNVLSSALPTLTSGTGGVTTAVLSAYSETGFYSLNGATANYNGSQGSSVNASYQAPGYAYFNCINYGSPSITAYVSDASGATITSNALTIRCGGAIDTYVATLDKSSYKPGDIATLTITAKDAAGGAVTYGTTLGTGASVALPGMTAVTTPATTDTAQDALNGVWTYTYTVNDNASGSYAGAVKIPVASTSAMYNKPATIQYTVSSGAVSNAEVLASIVKLIASINKQIAALQKLLTKKK